MSLLLSLSASPRVVVCQLMSALLVPIEAGASTSSEPELLYPLVSPSLTCSPSCSLLSALAPLLRRPPLAGGWSGGPPSNSIAKESTFAAGNFLRSARHSGALSSSCPETLLKTSRPLTAFVLVTASRQGCYLRLIACCPGERRAGRTLHSSSGPTSVVFNLFYGLPYPAHSPQAPLPPLPVLVFSTADSV